MAIRRDHNLGKIRINEIAFCDDLGSNNFLHFNGQRRKRRGRDRLLAEKEKRIGWRIKNRLEEKQ